MHGDHRRTFTPGRQSVNQNMAKGRSNQVSRPPTHLLPGEKLSELQSNFESLWHRKQGDDTNFLSLSKRLLLPIETLRRRLFWVGNRAKGRKNFRNQTISSIFSTGTIWHDQLPNSIRGEVNEFNWQSARSWSPILVRLTSTRSLVSFYNFLLRLTAFLLWSRGSLKLSDPILRISERKLFDS